MVNRYLRNSFVYERWGKRLVTESVLDVGCDVASMRGKYPGYKGIDIGGKPDVKVNLEKEKIPFRKNSFQVVMCLDVLEHVDNLHDVLDQIKDIAREYIILSFPNELRWSNLFKYFKGGINNREFGFSPENRHKWFLSYSQSRDFIREYARQNNLKIHDEYTDLGRVGKVVHGIMGSRFPNLMPYGYFVVLGKAIKYK